MSKLHVTLQREPFADTLTIIQDNGYSEELLPDEARAWFRERNASMPVVEEAMDHCWNFYRAEININNAVIPETKRMPGDPNI